MLFFLEFQQCFVDRKVNSETFIKNRIKAESKRGRKGKIFIYEQRSLSSNVSLKAMQSSSTRRDY